MSAHSVKKECKFEQCQQFFVTGSRWDNQRAQNLGWFLQRNGDVWCSIHIPEWVAEWRSKKGETMTHEEIEPAVASARGDEAQAQREKNTTCEGILVRRDQIWENLDTRQSERHVVIESVADGEAQVRDHYGTKCSTLSVARMHRHSAGVRLVLPGELKYGARTTSPDERTESR